jgi:hypothetical protein
LAPVGFVVFVAFLTVRPLGCFSARRIRRLFIRSDPSRSTRVVSARNQLRAGEVGAGGVRERVAHSTTARHSATPPPLLSLSTVRSLISPRCVDSMSNEHTASSETATAPTWSNHLLNGGNETHHCLHRPQQQRRPPSAACQFKLRSLRPQCTSVRQQL